MVSFHAHLSDHLVEITDVRQHPENPNNGDVDAIMESMRVNGVYAGVIAQRSTGHILAGNHRYAALRGLGAEQIPVDWLDVSDEGAKRILLADNRTTRLGRDNEADLLALLQELAATEAGLAGTAFSVEDMAYLAEEEAGFGQSDPLGSTLIQIVLDYTDEGVATDALDHIRQNYPDARMVYL